MNSITQMTQRTLSTLQTQGTKPKVVAAIPCLNEEQFISDIVTRARRYVDNVIVVDDGSTDNTSAITKGKDKLKRRKKVENTQAANCKAPTILITGGCGFIGINVAKYLYSKGYKIRILDNLSVGKKEKLTSAGLPPSAVELVIGDVRDRDTVERAVCNIKAVVHLAAHTSVVESLGNPEETWHINVTGTLNLLEFCRLKGVQTFIFASSNAVLGEQAAPVDETKIPKPISPYGASKLAGEALCTAYYHSFALNTVSLRFANCYGPYSENKPMVITKFINWARQDKPLIIYGNGSQTRDFTHVGDVCQSIYLCLAAVDSVAGEIFQIGSGVETSINKLAEIIQEIMGKKLPIINKPKRRGEIERNYSNITKARKILGFEPKINLKTGLEELCELFKLKT
ncbi:MAG: NAD-dependent epimerase/dehydratase family protein [Chloroflexi bacterium]|nr:NAD-dependent epimerase/dehydratase family protein [Chloroflexota bacterium]